MWRRVWGGEGGGAGWKRGRLLCRKKKTREGRERGKEGEGEGEASQGVGGAQPPQPSLYWADGRVLVLGRMFLPRGAGQWEARASPLGRGLARARECVAQLKECVRKLPVVFVEGSFSSTLMVVQTLRMKIQESPVTCDMGRGGGGGGEVRGADPDCEKTGCEDVPRLDLTALTEDSSWGGEASQAAWAHTRLLYMLPPLLSHTHVRTDAGSAVEETLNNTQTHVSGQTSSSHRRPLLPQPNPACTWLSG